MKICSPFAGIVRYHCAAGDCVRMGQTVATVESIKLEAPVHSPVSGEIQSLSEADFNDIWGGQELAIINPDK